jgi:Patatin-like phospholipase
MKRAAAGLAVCTSQARHFSRHDKICRPSAIRIMIPRHNRNLEEDSRDRGKGKTAFVFAGGGNLGAVQVGMLRVLLEAGVQPDFVIGTSVGVTLIIAIDAITVLLRMGPGLVGPRRGRSGPGSVGFLLDDRAI